MTDKEKLEKIYEFVRQQEDFFYKPIEEGRYGLGSVASTHCMLQAASFQKVRCFIEKLTEE